MRAVRRRRLIAVMLMLLFFSGGTLMVMWSLGQNVNLYYTPSQLAQGQVTSQQDFRVGGLVVKDSVHHAAKGLAVEFVLTDYSHTVHVHYSGLLPALFREGQGIVVKGRMDKQGQFHAHQVLAKHDENYMPPEVKASLQPKDVA